MPRSRKQSSFSSPAPPPAIFSIGDLQIIFSHRRTTKALVVAADEYDSGTLRNRKETIASQAPEILDLQRIL
jgi:hypothetical protein